MAGLGKLRKEGHSYLDSLECFQCKAKLRSFEGHEDRCSDCLLLKPKQPVKLFCSSHVPTCEVCSKSCDLPSKKLEILSSFFSVTCFEHKDSAADTLHKMTFRPLCSDCLKPFQKSELEKIDYCTIENTYFDLYNSLFSMLNNDQKRRVMTRSLSDLIIQTRWMMQVKSGIFCVNHPKIATFFSENFTPLCENCENLNGFSIQNDFLNLKRFIKEKIKENSEFSNRLSKFLIEFCWINERINFKNNELRNILLLEVVDLKNFRKDCKRCVGCLGNLLVGMRKGIILSCGHLLCFSCYKVNNVKNCLIDNQPVDPIEYLSPSNLEIPQCHFIHELNPKSPILKLPCFHYSCEDHSKSSTCLQCGFNLKSSKFPSKLSSKTSNLINFTTLTCLFHQQPISKFSLKTHFFYCEFCEIRENSSSLHEINLSKVSFTTSLLHKIIKSHLNPSKLSRSTSKSFKKLSIPGLTFLKVSQYLGIISLQHLLKYILCTRILNQDPLMHYARFPYKSFELFKPQENFKDFSIEDPTALVLSLSPKVDFILTGSIFNLSFFKSRKTFFRLLIKSVELRVFSKEEEILESGFDERPVVTSLKDGKVFALHQPVYASSGLVYVFIYRLEPGLQVKTSKAFERLAFQLAGLEKFKGKIIGVSRVLQACQGGVFSGICAVEINEFLAG